MVANHPPPPPAADWPNVPDFQVLGKLGGGGMGIVYKALQLSVERVVALKVIRRDYLRHNTLLLRFRREHKLLGRLAHPNVVVLHDAGKAGDTPFYSMEYVKGIDLGELVKRRGRLPVAWACEFVRQAALGLQHAADQGVVHRDVKPSNLMVTLPPGRARELAELGAARPGAPPFPYRECVVKVLDMGLARLLLPPLDGDESFKTLTHVSEFMGTPDFVAPEQVIDAHGVDVRADIYNLGCTFYYLLTRQVPFPGCTTDEKLRKHRYEYPSPVELLRPEVGPDVADVLRLMIDKDPGRRFQMPAEVVRALEPLCGAEPVVALPPPAADGADLAATQTTLPPESGGPARTRLVDDLPPTFPSAPEAATAAFRPPDDASFVGRLARREAGEVWDPFTMVEGFVRPVDQLRILEGHAGDVCGVAFAPDGRHALSGGWDRTLRLWDLESGREVRRFSGHTSFVLSVAYSPDGRRVLSGSKGGAIRLWDAGTGRRLARFDGHLLPVWSLAFAPDGRRALSGSGDDTVRLWDLESKRELRCFSGHTDWVLAVAFSPDGKLAVSCGHDHTLRLWDVDAGREVRRLHGHTDWVSAVTFAPDGRHVLSGSYDQTLRLWDMDAGREVRRYAGPSSPVLAVALAPDGRRALSGGHDGVVRLWDVATGDVVRRLEGHMDWVWSVAFSPDGRRALSGSADQTVRLWQVPP